MLYHYMRFRLRFASLLPFLSYDFVLYERSSLPFCLKVQRMMIFRFSIDLFCGVCLPLPKYFSIPKRRAIDSSQMGFSRKFMSTRILLHGLADSRCCSSWVLSLVSYIRPLSFFPSGQTLSFFFKDEFEPSIHAFLHLAIQLIAIWVMWQACSWLLARKQNGWRRYF